MATQHRGEIVRDIVRKMGINQAKLARALGVSRSSLYRYYEVRNLSLVLIRQIGTAISYDFSANIRGMAAEASVTAEPLVGYGLETLDDFRTKLLQVYEQLAEKVRQYDELKAQYDALLAEHNTS